MTAINTPRYATRAPLTARWARNGKYPEASYQNELAQQANHAARWLTKEPFSYSVPISEFAGSRDTDRDRWRFSWRSGPYARYLVGRAIMAPRSGSEAASPYSKLTVTNGAGSTVGTMEFHAGGISTDAGATNTPAYWTECTEFLASSGAAVTLGTDTEYFGLVTDIDYGRILALDLYEVSLESDTDNGYTAPVATGSPIFDADRSSVATMARNMWKKGARQLLNWTVDHQESPRTTTSSDETNLIDNTLTGGTAYYGAAAPGYLLDLANRTRVSGSGVPIVMKVYASRGTGNGSVKLISDGTDEIAAVSITGTAAWYSTTATIDLGAFSDENNPFAHLTFSSSSGTCSVYAVSVYEYQA